MGQPDREAEPFFTQPVRQITVMLICLGLVGFGAYVAFPRVAPVFLANLYLNGFILFVFIIGVFACFWQVAQLMSSVSWIEGFVGGRPGHAMVKPPRLLAPLAALLRGRGPTTQISSSSAGSILESVATRIEEARDITRYIGSLLIFLGLLGTFYGLATTVPAVVDTIKSLAPKEGESGVEVFSRLQAGLESQLGGMGVAFASSLLGLSGSLVVGLLELFAGHGQNRFYRELEDWLSTITRLGFAGSESDGDVSAEHSASVALLEHFSEQLEKMQGIFTRSDEARAELEGRVAHLAESIERLATNLADNSRSASAIEELAESQKRVAESQERLIAMLEEREEEGGAHVDAESRMRLRSIDVQLLRILEEMSAGRQESLADLRSDLAALTAAINALAREPVASAAGRR